MKLPFKVITLENQKVIETKEAYLELFDTHLVWVARFTSEEPVNPDDKMQGVEEVENDFEVTALKEWVTGCDKILVYSAKYDGEGKQYVWKILISIGGMNDDVRIYFRKQEAAQDFYNKITAWILKK